MKPTLSEFLLFLFDSIFVTSLQKLQFQHYVTCKSVISDSQRFYPTSPLRDYTSTPVRRRRSQSAGVRFKETREETAAGEDVRNRDRPTTNQCQVLLSCSFREFPQEGTLSQQHRYEKITLIKSAIVHIHVSVPLQRSNFCVALLIMFNILYLSLAIPHRFTLCTNP